MEAIAARRSGRTFDTKMLSDQVLADLLWATWGISSEDGKRVVPTARNRQDIDLYVLLPTGSYRYNAAKNCARFWQKSRNSRAMRRFTCCLLPKTRNTAKCTPGQCTKTPVCTALQQG